MKKFLTLFILIGLVVGFTACSSDDDNGTKTYTITFHANGGTGTMLALTDIAEGDFVTLTANAFEKDEHIFAGWSLTSDGTAVHSNEAQFQMGTSNVTLYAVWLAVQAGDIVITFNPNGGSGTMMPQSVPENTSVDLNENTFTREGYRFEGWSTTADGTVVHLNEANISVQTSNIDLFAVWAEITEITITFHANGGAGTMPPQVVAANTSITLNANTFTSTREYYVFAGWATSAGTFVSVVHLDEANIAVRFSDINLFAVWTEIRYKINFDIAGGILATEDGDWPSGMGPHGHMRDQWVTFGQEIPEYYLGRTDEGTGLPVIQKPGYELVGFYTEPEGGGIMYLILRVVYGTEWWLQNDGMIFNRREDITLYAFWRPIQ